MNRAKANVYLIGLFLFCQQAIASDSQPDQPEMELLEFLGSGEMLDGEWLDPLSMADLEQQDLQAKQQEERDNE